MLVCAVPDELARRCLAGRPVTEFQGPACQRRGVVEPVSFLRILELGELHRALDLGANDRRSIAVVRDLLGDVGQQVHDREQDR